MDNYKFMSSDGYDEREDDLLHDIILSHMDDGYSLTETTTWLNEVFDKAKKSYSKKQEDNLRQERKLALLHILNDYEYLLELYGIMNVDLASEVDVDEMLNSIEEIFLPLAKMNKNTTDRSDIKKDPIENFLDKYVR